MLHFLAHHGIPLETAHAMTHVERVAAYVAHGEFEGGEFDWVKLCWKKKT